MDLVLYHPSTLLCHQCREHGAQAFLPHLIALTLVSCWLSNLSRCGRFERPVPFTLFEMGSRIPAADILGICTGNIQMLEYIIVERSAALRRNSSSGCRNLPIYPYAGPSLRRNPTWLNHGLLFSNELVDALPHQFVIEKGSYEKFTLQRCQRQKGRSPSLGSTGEPSTPLLAGYFELVTIDLSSNVYPD